MGDLEQCRPGSALPQLLSTLTDEFAFRRISRIDLRVLPIQIEHRWQDIAASTPPPSDLSADQNGRRFRCRKRRERRGANAFRRDRASVPRLGRSAIHYGFSISRFSASAPEIVYLGNTIVYLGNTNAPASADLRSARQCFLACTRQPTRDERLEPTRDERLALSLQLSGPLLAAARALPVAPLRYEASSASIQGLAVVRRCCAPLVGALVPVRGIIGDGLRHGHAPGSTAN